MLPSMPALGAARGHARGAHARELQGVGRVPVVGSPVAQVARPRAPTECTNATIENVQSKVLEWQSELPTENEEDINEMNMVTAYFNKVQSKLTYRKFAKFHEALNQFDPYKETPVQLYRKMEAILLPDHEELLEEFLLFLSPGQATELGRFMDHLMLSKISKFIEALQTTFSRKPAKLRKVMRAFTNGLQTNDLTKLKTIILPHLRSSQRLTQYFKALLPDERPPDSLYTDSNIEQFPESSWPADNDYDCWELEDQKETVNAQEIPKDHVEIKYMHGRVFLQQGKTLRSGRVSFPHSPHPISFHTCRLAPSHHPLLETNPLEDQSSPNKSKNISKNPRRTNTKSPCVRNIMKGKKSPERKNSDAPIKHKCVTRIIDAQIEAKCMETKKNSPELKPAAKIVRTISFELSNDSVGKVEARCKRKREPSPVAKKVERRSRAKHSKVETKAEEVIDEAKKPKGRKRKHPVEKLDPKHVKKKPVESKHKSVKSEKQENSTKSNRSKSDVKHTKLDRKPKKSNIGIYVPDSVISIENTDTSIEKPVTSKVKPDSSKAKPDISTEKAEKTKISTNSTGHDSKPFKMPPSRNPDPPKVNKVWNWTRQEDKTILEVLKGQTGSDQTFTRIKELLPHRTLEEVTERFFYVMDLLQRMALGEVT